MSAILDRLILQTEEEKEMRLQAFRSCDTIEDVKYNQGALAVVDLYASILDDMKKKLYKNEDKDDE